MKATCTQVLISLPPHLGRKDVSNTTCCSAHPLQANATERAPPKNLAYYCVYTRTGVNSPSHPGVLHLRTFLAFTNLSNPCCDKVILFTKWHGCLTCCLLIFLTWCKWHLGVMYTVRCPFGSPQIYHPQTRKWSPPWLRLFQQMHHSHTEHFFQ